MNKIETKVCIVGAGPAGTVASMLLSKEGIDHVVIDKASFPRDKICGESYDGRVTHILNRVDPQIVKDLINNNLLMSCRDYRVYFKEKEVRLSGSPKHTSKLHGKRLLLDNYLYNYARDSKYAQFITGRKIEEIQHEKGKIVLKDDSIRVNAEHAILASGCSDTLSAGTNYKDKFLVSRSYFKNRSKTICSGTEFHIYDDPYPHCLVVCPLPNNELNVAVGILQSDYKKYKVAIENIFYHSLKKAKEKSEVLRDCEQLEGLKGGFVPLQNKVMASDKNNLHYIGAAAYSINPITGWGVGNALAMSEEVVEVIVKKVKSGINDQNHQLQNRIRRRLANEIKIGAMANFLFAHPSFLKAGTRLFFNRRVARLLNSL